MSYTSSLCLFFLALVVVGCWAQEAERPPPEGPRRPPCFGGFSYWGSWGSWSSCRPLSGNCGRGTQSRTRRCIYRDGGICPFRPDVGVAEPVPERGPAPAPAPIIPFPNGCSGSSRESRACSVSCPITLCGSRNGGWAAWGCWSECRNGRRQRHRVCNKPAPQGWGRYCLGRPTETESCPSCAASQDIVFAIDGSGSIPQTDFNRMVSEVNSLIQSFDLDSASTSSDPSKVRVGIQVFDHRQYLKKHLNNFSIPSQPYAYPRGGTSIGAAITYARTQMFTSIRGDRRANQNTLVVITDGYSADAQAAATAAKNAGITIVAVGVGNNVNINHLRNIASSPNDAHLAGNFCEIGNFLRRRFNCNGLVFRRPAGSCTRFTATTANRKADTDFSSS